MGVNERFIELKNWAQNGIIALLWGRKVSTGVLRSESQVEAPALKNWINAINGAKIVNAFNSAVESTVNFVRSLQVAPNYYFAA